MSPSTPTSDSLQAATSQRGTGPFEATWDRMSSPAAVAAVFLSYAVIHVALRLAFSATLPFDDALAEETLQRTFALAYQVRNPPLWEWLLLGLHQVLGTGFLPHLVLRYGLMVAIALALRSAVETATGDRRLAAAGAYGLLTFYWFGWHFHEFVTHTLLLITVCLVHLDLTMRWIRRPGMALATGLAAVTALGLITKWNFALYLGLLVLSLVASRETRSRLLDRRLVAVPILSALVLGPVLAGIARLGGDVVAMSQTNLIGEQPYLARLAEGLSEAAANVPLFFMPWAVFVGIALYRSGPARSADPVRSLLVRLSGLGVGVLLAAVLLLGVREIGTRYLYPIGVPAIVAGLAVVAARGRSMRYARIVAVAAPVLAVVVLAIRVATLTSPGFPQKQNNRNLEPYAAVARLLTAEGYGQAAFLTAAHQESGNLLAAMPEAIAASTATVRLMKPGTYASERTCVLFWHAGFVTPGRAVPEPQIPGRLLEAAPGAAGRPVRTFEVAWAETLLGSPRTGIYRIVDLGPDATACRLAFGAVTDR